jgi:hypothetical protein
MRILEPVTFCERIGARAELRLTREHSLGRVFPVGREMTRPTTVSITDRNGEGMNAWPKPSTPRSMCCSCYTCESSDSRVRNYSRAMMAGGQRHSTVRPRNSIES